MKAIDYTPGDWFQAATVDDLERFFVSRLPAIREAAQAHGYAIGLHGSCRRDLDLIAVPWRDGSSDADTLAHAIAQAACGLSRAGAYDWESKPASRIAASIPICWPGWHGQDGAGHIDLSVMPQAPKAAAVTPVGKDCPRCRASCSWGMPDRAACAGCVGTPDGKGSLYVPLNA